jgi:hypothetical protein
MKGKEKEKRKEKKMKGKEKEKRKEKKRKEKERKEKKRREKKRKEKKRRGKKGKKSRFVCSAWCYNFLDISQLYSGSHTSIFLTLQHNETFLNIPRPTNLHCSVTFRVLTCVFKHGQTVLCYSSYFIHSCKLYKIQHFCSSLVFLSTCSALFLLCF